jgi:uncharacterized damage-inducible protein DinB
MITKDEFIRELKHESALTMKILQRVPLDQKDWKPHEKSMTIGRLATHVAETTRWISVILENEVFDFAVNFKPPHTASTTEELLSIFQTNTDGALALLEKATEEIFEDSWTVKKGGQVVYEFKKKQAIRGWGFSHQYHHRGQLSVYLRMLDIPVPGMYGPSADEK